MTNFSISLTKEIILSHFDSTEQFPIDFEDAWQWLEYSKKGNGERSFKTAGFVAEIDFRSSHVKAQREIGGSHATVIKMTVDCFRRWALKSPTKKAKEISDYYQKNGNFDGFIITTSSKKISEEKSVQIFLITQLKQSGKVKSIESEVLTLAGKIDILTNKEIIEIKKVRGWKGAIGQVIIYGSYYPQRAKRIHLFGECHKSIRSLIENNCKELSILVTWQNDEIIKDYRTSGASSKVIPAFMYPPFHPDVETCVTDYCAKKNFTNN